jgi:hypothetical protein
LVTYLHIFQLLHGLLGQNKSPCFVLIGRLRQSPNPPPPPTPPPLSSSMPPPIIDKKSLETGGGGGHPSCASWLCRAQMWRDLVVGLHITRVACSWPRVRSWQQIPAAHAIGRSYGRILDGFGTCCDGLWRRVDYTSTAVPCGSMSSTQLNCGSNRRQFHDSIARALPWARLYGAANLLAIQPSASPGRHDCW